MKFFACFVSVALLSIALAGCGGGGRVEAKKYPVTGTVNVDNQPLADGMIYFKDIATGAADGIEIKNGQFSGKSEAGQRRVEIFAYRAETSEMGGVVSETKVNTLPAPYNTQSTLSKEVKADGANAFTFDVTSR